MVGRAVISFLPGIERTTTWRTEVSSKNVFFCLMVLSVVPVSAAAVSYDFSYTSSLNQTFTSPSTGIFSEVGQVTFSNLSLSARFTGGGTFLDYGLTAQFQNFNFQLYQDSKLVGTSTTLVGGEAHLTPTGDGFFGVTAKFQPVGSLLSGYKAIEVAGTVIATPGEVAAGRYLSGVHTGSGTVTLTNPEPTTFILLGSGMAAFALLRYLQQQKRRASDR